LSGRCVLGVQAARSHSSALSRHSSRLAQQQSMGGRDGTWHGGRTIFGRSLLKRDGMKKRARKRRLASDLRHDSSSDVRWQAASQNGRDTIFMRGIASISFSSSWRTWRVINGAQSGNSSRQRPGRAIEGKAREGKKKAAIKHPCRAASRISVPQLLTAFRLSRLALFTFLRHQRLSSINASGIQRMSSSRRRCVDDARVCRRRGTSCATISLFQAIISLAMKGVRVAHLTLLYGVIDEEGKASALYGAHRAEGRRSYFRQAIDGDQDQAAGGSNVASSWRGNGGGVGRHGKARTNRHRGQ